MGWDHFFTSRPVASLFKRAVNFSWLAKALSPYFFSSFDINWMAEVCFEQWDWFWLGGFTSVSPLAILVAVSSKFFRNAVFNKSDIFGQIHWSAEVMIWDQFFSGGPVATSSNRAGIFSHMGIAIFPNRFLSILVDNYWMAEVFSEQWDLFWFSWVGGGGLSVSPLASFIASSFNIS
jgi:hypothetical protein